MWKSQLNNLRSEDANKTDNGIDKDFDFDFISYIKSFFRTEVSFC